MIQHITSFDQYLEIIKNYPTVVKFTADWCAPCRRSQPLYSSLANSFGTEVVFLEIDIDLKANSKISDLEKVASIPFIIFYNDGVRDITLDILGLNLELIESRIKSFCDNIQPVIPEVIQPVIPEVIQPTNAFSKEYLLSMMEPNTKNLLKIEEFTPDVVAQTLFNIFKQFSDGSLIPEDTSKLQVLSQENLDEYNTIKSTVEAPDGKIQTELLSGVLTDIFIKVIDKKNSSC